MIFSVYFFPTCLSTCLYRIRASILSWNIVKKHTLQYHWPVSFAKGFVKIKNNKGWWYFPLTKLKTNHFYLSLGINDHTITEKLHNFPFSHLRPWQISKHWLSPSWGIAQLYFGCRIFWICKTVLYYWDWYRLI